MLKRLMAVLLLCGVVLSAVAAQAQGQDEPRFLGPTASLHGNTGLWNVVSPQTLPPGQAAFSVWYDRMFRDPGALTTSAVGVGGAVGITDWFEFGANWEINRRVLMRQFEETSFGQQSLGLFGTQTPNSPPTFGELAGGSNSMPQLRSPATRTGTLTGAAGYYNEFPFTSRNSSNGVGPFTLGFKINAMAESKGDPFALGFYTYATIPSHRSATFLRARSIQTGDLQFGSDILASKSMMDFARLYGNIGFRRLQSPDNGRIVLLSDIVPIRLAFLAPIDSRIQFLAEGTADLFVGARTPNTSFGAEDPVDVTFGFRAFLSRYMNLSAGYRRNVSQTNEGGDKHGFVVMLGYNYGPPRMDVLPTPPTLTCTGDPAQVEAGQPVRLSAMGVSATGAPLDYTWTTNGGTIQGTGPVVTLQTTGLSAGTYIATVRATEAPGVSADCNVTIMVRAPAPPPPPPPARPPTVSLTVNPPRVQVGGAVNAVATANSPDGRPLTYRWTVTPQGQVQGTGANVRIDTTGLQPGNYTVRVVVTDDRGLSAEATAQFAVDAPPPPPPPPQVSKLDECLFARNSARVDNVCKAKLDNVALRLQSEADATLAIVGYSESNETNAAQLAQNRANNVRTYLQQDKGIAAGRLDVRTGTGAVGAEYRRVDLHLVPRGATFTGARIFPSVDGETPVVAEQEQEPATPVAAAPASGNARREVIARVR